MRDFTLNMYRRLLVSLKEAGYTFLPFGDYLPAACNLSPATSRLSPAASNLSPVASLILLRHDVDKKPENSLATAQIEHELGIRASYYFRCLPCSNDPDIIRQIVALGHEIGYHYEDMSLCQGNKEKAIAHFTEWLSYFRQFYDVKTICMHGAPTSKYDGRDLWKQYDYHDYGIIGEPYFDVDFNDFFYLTDTGRCWDGYKVSVRDKIEGHQDRWIAEGRVFHKTTDILAGLEHLPNHVMITTHPQRWTDSVIGWGKELILQSLKNIIKRCYVA